MTAVNQSQSHSTKKGITVGAFGRFIGSVAFIGIMLWLPLIASLPIGIFLHALGLSVIKPIENVGYSSSDDVDNGGGGDGGSVDIIRIGLVAFGLVMAQGVIVGIIFGIITAKIKKLHITNRRKGVSLGLATGVSTLCLCNSISVSVNKRIGEIPSNNTLYITRIVYACNKNSITKFLPFHITWLWLVCLFDIRLYPWRNISLGNFSV